MKISKAMSVSWLSWAWLGLALALGGLLTWQILDKTSAQVREHIKQLQLDMAQTQVRVFAVEQELQELRAQMLQLDDGIRWDMDGAGKIEAQRVR